MTSNHGYNTPEKGTTDWHIPLNENFANLDGDVEIRAVGANLSQYSPKSGAKFLATDTGDVYLGDGSDWQKIGSIGDSGASNSPVNFEYVPPSNGAAGINAAIAPDTKIILGRGTYEVNEQIVIDTVPLVIEGQGYGTELRSNIGDDVIEFVVPSSTGSGTQVGAEGGDLKNGVLRDLWVNGESASGGSGMHNSDPNMGFWHFDNVQVTGMPNHGFDFSDGGLYNCQFTNCRSRENDGDGMIIDGGSSGSGSQSSSVDIVSMDMRNNLGTNLNAIHCENMSVIGGEFNGDDGRSGADTTGIYIGELSVGWSILNVDCEFNDVALHIGNSGGSSDFPRGGFLGGGIFQYNNVDVRIETGGGITLSGVHADSPTTLQVDSTCGGRIFDFGNSWWNAPTIHGGVVYRNGGMPVQNLSAVSGGYPGDCRIDDGSNTSSGDPEMAIWNGSSWRLMDGSYI